MKIGAEFIKRIISQFRVRPRMVEAIIRLRLMGFKVAALTNNWKNSMDVNDKQNVIIHADVRNIFNEFVESAVEGVRKPDKRIYQVVLSRLNVNATDCIFLDDIGIYFIHSLFI